MFGNSKHTDRWEPLTENRLNERHSVFSIISGLLHTTTQWIWIIRNGACGPPVRNHWSIIYSVWKRNVNGRCIGLPVC